MVNFILRVWNYGPTQSETYTATEQDGKIHRCRAIFDRKTDILS